MILNYRNRGIKSKVRNLQQVKNLEHVKDINQVIFSNK